MSLPAPLSRRLFLALAVVVAVGLVARRVWADPFTFLQPGFSQQLYGTAPRTFGGVAFAPDGDVWASECGGTSGFFTRFDQQSTTVVHGTTVHPEAPGSPFPSIVACGIANHPNGALYSNTGDGVAKLDVETAAPVDGPFASAGNQNGIATDPVTGNLVYVRNDGGIEFADPAFTSSGIFSGVTFDLNVAGVAFDPTGNFLFVAVQNFDTAPGTLFILNRDGGTVQQVDMNSPPSGIAFHDNPTPFVVTNNTDGTMTRLDFPGNDYSQPPAQSVFARGGFPGSLMQVGPDAALYVTQAGTRFDDGTVTQDNSIVRISGGFALPPGVVGQQGGPQFVAPTPANGATLTVTVGQTLTFTVQASQPSNVTVSLSANGIPPGASQSPPLPAFGNPVSSDFSWQPGPGDIGSHPITYRAKDEESGRFVETSVTVVVQAPPAPQFVAPTPPSGQVFTVRAGQLVNFTVKAAQDSNLPLTLTVNGLPGGASQSPPLPTSGNPVTSAFSWRPTASDAGAHVITYRAQDPTGQSVERSVTIVVQQSSSVLSVRLSLFNAAGRMVAQVLLKRRADGSFAGRFPNLKPGVYRAFAAGYASSDGTGSVIATANGSATVRAHQTITVHLVWRAV